MRIPSDNKPGYERARAVEPEIARNYVAHTYVADPEADALMLELASLDPFEMRQLLQAAMDDDEDGLKQAPAVLREFFDGLTPPDWVDLSEFPAGVRMFHRNSKVILASFVSGVLIEGFMTNISKSFFITGRVRDQGVRRLATEQPAFSRVFSAGRIREIRGWLEIICEDSLDSCASEAASRRIGRMGRRRLGCSVEFSPFGFRDYRVFCEVARAYEKVRGELHG